LGSSLAGALRPPLSLHSIPAGETRLPLSPLQAPKSVQPGGANVSLEANRPCGSGHTLPTRKSGNSSKSLFSFLSVCAIFSRSAWYHGARYAGSIIGEKPYRTVRIALLSLRPFFAHFPDELDAHWSRFAFSSVQPAFALETRGSWVPCDSSIPTWTLEARVPLEPIPAGFSLLPDPSVGRPIDGGLPLVPLVTLDSLSTGSSGTTANTRCSWRSVGSIAAIHAWEAGGSHGAGNSRDAVEAREAVQSHLAPRSFGSDRSQITQCPFQALGSH